MRKNEYESIENFVSEYSGGRDPGNEKWFGLEFKYCNVYYRLDISSGKYILQKILFDHQETYPDSSGYKVICQFDTIEELLNCESIENTKFRNVIMDDNTVILGKD